MREHVMEDARIHYVITNGGGQPNVVPPEAEVWYYIRANEFDDVVLYFDWIKDIAEGEGNLATRLPLQRRDEIGQLAQWFNRFLDNLQGMVRDIASHAETLGVRSTDLSQSSSCLLHSRHNRSYESASCGRRARRPASLTPTSSRFTPSRSRVTSSSLSWGTSTESRCKSACAAPDL